MDSNKKIISDADFKFISSLIKKEIGIILDIDKKKELVSNRILRRIKALDISSFPEYIELLKSDRIHTEIENLVNSITTNLTSFFRESHHFEHLEKYFQQLISKKDRIRIWCAGCSTGQEPYSVAMVVKSLLNGSNKDVKILATDVDTNVLETGKAGIYSTVSLKEIPTKYQQKYIKNLPEKEDFEIDRQVKSLIHFKQLNLLKPWPMSGKFDIIFCRNVIIYFDNPTKTSLFKRYHNIINENGLLFLGHSENIFGAEGYFQSIGKTIYQCVKK